MLSGNWQERKHLYDFVIVGSGYGGAITAARLATADLDPKPTVCVLERGREWPIGSFPDTLDKFADETRSTANPLGLYETLNYRDISVVKASGLGGCSLVTANVALVPDPEVFEAAGWPRSLNRESLLKYYQRALEVLRAQPHPKAAELPKYRALQAAARGLGLDAQPLDLAVNFTVQGPNAYGVDQVPCLDCGDCFTGCNFGAKNTLYMNYLPMARRGGAEIYTQAKVEWIEKLSGGGWRIHGRHYSDRTHSETFQLDARNVVLAAGSINTTEILMRSESHGLKVSPRLGSGFSGNGDFYAVAYNSDVPVHALGIGRQVVDDARSAPGPTITGVVHMNRERPITNRFVIEDSVLPSAFVRAAQLAFAAIRGEDTDSGDEAAERQRRQADLSKIDPRSDAGALAHTLVFLVMSMDNARGSMVFETPLWEPDGRMKIVWDDVGRQSHFAAINRTLRRMARELGSTFIESTLWSAFDLRRLITLHPIGGCPVGEDYLQGAVDEFGRVFAGDGTVHEGLFVADGALVPSALGANPFLTIAALAERIAERKIDQLRGNQYPQRPVTVGPVGLDPRDMVGVRDAELEKLFRRCDTLGIDHLINTGEFRVDVKNRKIFNDAIWKGFLPKALPLAELGVRLHLGYYKRFWKEGDRYRGETRVIDGRIPLGHSLEEVTLDKRINDFDPGRYILLRYTDPGFDALVYDVMKIISDDIILYRGYTGEFPHGRRGFTAPLLRNYGFEHMSANDHTLLYESGTAPTAEDLEGVWRMDAVASANHASAVAYLSFQRQPDGRLESRYQLLGFLDGLVMPRFLTSHFQLHDFTAFHDEIRKIDPDFLVGRWIADLPEGVAGLTPAGSVGLLHVMKGEAGRKQFGFWYTLTRAESGEQPENTILRPFLDVQLPQGVGMTFRERMEGEWCALALEISIPALNEFIEGADHEASVTGSVTFSDWEGHGPRSFALDARASRLYYLRVNPATREAEIVYHLEFAPVAGERFVIEGRKYMQKDESGGPRGVREVFTDYTTLDARLFRLDDGERKQVGAGLLKFRTFEDTAAAGNLLDFLGGFRVTGTDDPQIKMQARLRFLAFTARFVQREYDPLAPGAGVLPDRVRNEVARLAETPDALSTLPTSELQTVLRDTKTLPLETLLNRGGVRYDFERRRIWRDSFWKGSFAEDHLLGLEERLRKTGRLGAIFAGGSFWKRFDRVENGIARGHVVNYEMHWLPGDPEVREIEYPNDSRKYFRKGDKILLLNYRNQPYRIVYDTIKAIDENNTIGVMHLGQFPDGFEFATFVMARHNYPLEKMSVQDHAFLFTHPQTRAPQPQELAGDWEGHLVFLDRPDVSLLNQANPVLLRVSFRPTSAGVEAAYRLSLPVLSPEFVVQESIDQLRRIDERTLIGAWRLPDVSPALFLGLQDSLEHLAGAWTFRFVLTRV